MKIAVCEDCREDLEKLVSYLKKSLERKGVHGEIVSFTTSEELLAAVETVPFPIYFLDIYVDDVNGVEIAQAIRLNTKSAIVFTTSSTDHMADGFNVDAVHYLVKPVTPEEVDTALSRCLRYIGEAERYIELSVNRKTIRVLFSNIVAVESQDKVCLLLTKDGGQIRVYQMKLDEIEKLLNDPRFLRCHRSFIINMDHVVRMERQDIVIQGGRRIPLRRSNRGMLQQQYFDYCFERQRRRD